MVSIGQLDRAQSHGKWAIRCLPLEPTLACTTVSAQIASCVHALDKSCLGCRDVAVTMVSDGQYESAVSQCE